MQPNLKIVPLEETPPPAAPLEPADEAPRARRWPLVAGWALVALALGEAAWLWAEVITRGWLS